MNFTIKDEDSDNDTKNMSAASAVWGLSDERGAPTIMERSIGNGIVITDAENGKLRVELTPSDTESLEGSYYHELQITDSDGRVSTVATGTLWFSESTV